MKAVRRAAVVLVCGLLAVLIGAPPADAKMPYFSVETPPAIPSRDLPAQLVVHLWNDQAHLTPASWQGPEVIDDLFCIFPAGHVVTGRTGCPGGFAVSVRKQDQATYVGSFRLPGAGGWTLVAFPGINRPLPAGYPDRIPIGATPPRRGHNVNTHAGTGIWFAVGLLALLGVPVLVAERRRRRPTPV